ncbi:MAG: acetyl-CoA carboxylase biotin carboxylase subunit [Planctomycetota bacterium]
MFNRILVANRGEIALRILRTCRRMGIETVVVYSKADRDAVYLRLADQAVCIGPAEPKLSYLNMNQIIAAAEVCDVEAIHPGYGFLSENAAFAEIVETCNIKFIGPTAHSMNLLGDKIAARKLAEECGVPCVPGSKNAVETDEEALRLAHEIGYPVLIKAAAGGGGRGMRQAYNDASLLDRLSQARTEAKNAFGSGACFIEKFIEAPRHVEVQIMADGNGHVLHMGERDCTTQRRYQKLIEESPSPIIDEKMRKALCDAAVKIAKKADYRGAGTVEFLLDGKGHYFFGEVNTRIQVEHPVTEQVTGLDLIELQIRIAAGEGLPLKQSDIVNRGHAIECRINCEDPWRNFAPSVGTINLYCPPTGSFVRVDSHLYSGYKIPPYYDSMLAKLIVTGADRNECIERTKRALSDFIVEGVHTTIPFFLKLMNHHKFITNQYHTRWIEEEFLKS